MNKVDEINLSNGMDYVVWKFDKNGIFSVKSIYNALTIYDAGSYFKKIWKGKISMACCK